MWWARGATLRAEREPLQPKRWSLKLLRCPALHHRRLMFGSRHASATLVEPQV